MYWSFPVTRARPGATVLARHGDPRMQNQYGRHVLLASQLYGPGRTVFIGFDSTYRWRYLSEDYFDGFWARLVDRVGRNKALGGRFPFQVNLGKSVYRVGDQVSIGVRYTEAAAVAEAAGTGGRAGDRRPAARAAPVRARARRSRVADRDLPGRAGRRLYAPDRPGDGGRCGLGRAASRRPLPRRASEARDRRAFAQPAAPGRSRPAHQGASSSSRTSASSTTPSPCAR